MGHRAHGLDRRQFVAAAVLASVGIPAWRPGSMMAARQADLADLGLPTIDVTITETGFEGVPETLDAGRYLLNATAESFAEGAPLAFLRPYQMSADQFLGFLGSPPPGASPVAAEGNEGDEGGALPAFVYQSTFAGGVFAATGQPGSAVIDLTEGEWIAWGDAPDAPLTPTVVTVTGAFPDNPPEPDADVMATLVDFGIAIEGDLTAGEHILRVENDGAQPHFIDFKRVPDGLTGDDLTAIIAGMMTGTPAAGLPAEEDFTTAGYAPTQSIATVTWAKLALEAGTYAAMCWFPTAGIGDPHAFHGMHTVFVVS